MLISDKYKLETEKQKTEIVLTEIGSCYVFE